MRDQVEQLETLRSEGARFAAAIRAAGPDATVPTCPEWTIRDLTIHLGEVHRWATAVVRDGVPKPSAVDPDHVGPLPDDAGLVDWFVDGHARLLDAFESAPGEFAAFTFLADPPPPLLFWARRQAHETEVHRVDAESALGTRSTFDVGSAADGIDEMLTGFAPRKHTPLHSESPIRLLVTADDEPGAWLLTISSDAPATERVVDTAGTAVVADCAVSGPAADLYLALWNRAGTDALTITGDRAVLDRFRNDVRIRRG